VNATQLRQRDERWLAYAIIALGLALPVACVLGYYF